MNFKLIRAYKKMHTPLFYFAWLNIIIMKWKYNSKLKLIVFSKGCITINTLQYGIEIYYY
jgi:hypothetical protein